MASPMAKGNSRKGVTSKNARLPESLSFRTSRLVLRFFRETDFAAWRDAYLHLPKRRNRWDMQRKRPAKTLTRARFRKVVEAGRQRRARGDSYKFAAFDGASGAFVGAASLMDISRGIFQNAYLGYFLLSPWWGKGLATEMTDAAIDIGFSRLKLHRVEAGIEPGNIRSEMVARRVGMRLESTSKRRLFVRGKWRDMRIWALTSEERGYRHPGGSLSADRF